VNRPSPDADVHDLPVSAHLDDMTIPSEETNAPATANNPLSALRQFVDERIDLLTRYRLWAGRQKVGDLVSGLDANARQIADKVLALFDDASTSDERDNSDYEIAGERRSASTRCPGYSDGCRRGSHTDTARGCEADSDIGEGEFYACTWTGDRAVDADGPTYHIQVWLGPTSGGSWHAVLYEHDGDDAPAIGTSLSGVAESIARMRLAFPARRYRVIQRVEIEVGEG
jgi:hypothetical protein